MFDNLASIRLATVFDLLRDVVDIKQRRLRFFVRLTNKSAQSWLPDELAFRHQISNGFIDRHSTHIELLGEFEFSGYLVTHWPVTTGDIVVYELFYLKVERRFRHNETLFDYTNRVTEFFTISTFPQAM
ncbi:hypothetical protein VCR20J5_220089 [Vibrio crassostreae]|nr:hypothetical protein VCR20J5_220089 [Vibrio crassostreae]